MFEKVFENLVYTDTDWSYPADLFVSWIVKNNFNLESFRNFAEWISDEQIDDVWHFFFGYHSIEHFANDWVAEEERESYLFYN